MARKPRPSDGPTSTERQQGKALLSAILGDAKARTAVDWKQRGDALEKALASGDRGALDVLTAGERATMLCWAAGNNRLDLLRGLLAAGVDPNAAVSIPLPAFNFYLERDRSPVEMLAIDADIESGEKGSITLRALCPALRNQHLDACRLLLQAGADPNIDAGTGVPALDAVGNGFADILQLLLDHGAKLDVRPGHRTLLHMAVANKRPEVTRLLLAAGMDANLPDGGGESPLESAARSGDPECVRLLLAAGAAVNPPDPVPEAITDPLLKVLHGRGQMHTSTPLIAAAELGHVEVVRELLKAGADWSRTTDLQRTAYDLARKNNHAPVVALLRQAGAAGPDTVQPVDLFMAAAAGDVAGVTAALTNGIPVDAIGGATMREPKVERAVREQASRGPEAVMSLLMQLGKGGGDTAMADAMATSRRQALQVPSEYHGLTALMIAAREGHADVVAALISRGAKVNVASTSTFTDGQTALHFAAQGGHVQVMRMLLDAGADPSVQGMSAADEPTEAPLHLAARKGHVEAIRLLLERGAKADAETFGDTPLMEAERAGHAEAAELLRQWSLSSQKP